MGSLIIFVELIFALSACFIAPLSIFHFLRQEKYIPVYISIVVITFFNILFSIYAVYNLHYLLTIPLMLLFAFFDIPVSIITALILFLRKKKRLNSKKSVVLFFLLSFIIVPIEFFIPAGTLQITFQKNVKNKIE